MFKIISFGTHNNSINEIKFCEHRMHKSWGKSINDVAYFMFVGENL